MNRKNAVKALILNSKYLKGSPEQYFTIPKGETVDSNTLGVAMGRIETVVDLLVSLEYAGYSKEKVSDIAFLLEGLVYQAKELAGEVQ